jgi:hypothetical protein
VGAGEERPLPEQLLGTAGGAGGGRGGEVPSEVLSRELVFRNDTELLVSDRPRLVPVRSTEQQFLSAELVGGSGNETDDFGVATNNRADDLLQQQAEGQRRPAERWFFVFMDFCVQLVET